MNHNAPPPQGPYAPPPGQGHADERGLFGNTNNTAQGQYPPGQYDQNAQGGHGGYDENKPSKKEKEKEKEKSGHSTAMLAGVGVAGLVGGGLIGAAIAHDSDSDDGHQAQPSYAPAPAAAMAPAPYMAPAPPQTGFEEPPPVPTHDADGDSISSSDRESLEEKREELIEAQEEYQEELEEAYDD